MRNFERFYDNRTVVILVTWQDLVMRRSEIQRYTNYEPKQPLHLPYFAAVLSKTTTKIMTGKCAIVEKFCI